MVNPIDIHKLTLEELSGVIALYPWYGGARMELCRRMSGEGALSEIQADSFRSEHVVSDVLHFGIPAAPVPVIYPFEVTEAK